MSGKKSLWDKFGKLNFSVFFSLMQFFSMAAARRFLYIGLEDRSIYEDSFSDRVLQTTLFGKTFPNPLGIAAGFDTSFRYADELMEFGFGFEEFGTFTRQPNGFPERLRYSKGQKAILVNAPYFRNKGITFAQRALINRRHLPHIAGISLASNLEVTDENRQTNLIFEQIEKELVEMVQLTAPYCDYITLNLSHPYLTISNLIVNVSLLENIIVHLKQVIQKIAPIANPRLLVKVPIDITAEQVSLLAETLMRAGADGVEVGGYVNAKNAVKKLLGSHALGFIAGKPLQDASTQTVEQFYTITKGQLPIIASGGIFSGDDAFAKICAGASLVQIHSAILFEGPGIGNKINKRLAYLLKTKGFKDVSDAVGSKFRRTL